MSAQFVVVCAAVDLLQLDAEGQGETFEVELPGIVLTEDVISYLTLNVMFGVCFKLIVEEIEDEVHDPVSHPSA